MTAETHIQPLQSLLPSCHLKLSSFLFFLFPLSFPWSLTSRDACCKAPFDLFAVCQFVSVLLLSDRGTVAQGHICQSRSERGKQPVELHSFHQFIRNTTLMPAFKLHSDEQVRGCLWEFFLAAFVGKWVMSNSFFFTAFFKTDMVSSKIPKAVVFIYSLATHLIISHVFVHY